MSQTTNSKKKGKLIQYSPVAGIILVVSGFLLLLDQYNQTHWLSLAIPILISIIFIICGFISRRKVWLIPGFVLLGISVAIFIIFQKIVTIETYSLIAIGIGFFSLSWLLLFLFLKILQKETHWWILFIFTISGAVSINFILPKITLLNFVFLLSIAIGICFIIWGGARKRLGLIIPGLLVFTIGSGIYSAWNRNITNGLLETGIMLVWFSLGWIMITVISRIISKKFVWWPLIPGGVLAMVGSGLYIGGNPGNALGFLQNTGSIGLILFGVYLILLKFGMNK